MSNIIPNNKDINELVEDNIRFILNTISNLTGRYVPIENDEEFSLGILAFIEAVEKYNSQKGNFHSFAKLVIESRIKNYLNKE
ncbi:MAG: sigma factor, partial [Clostridium perfringens]|nr:sigma factor [Clostridium perfringens]